MSFVTVYAITNALRGLGVKSIAIGDLFEWMPEGGRKSARATLEEA